jgi:cytochrome P450
MKSVLFLQSEVENPYSVYEEMLLANPIYRDDANNIWAVYSYENCKAVLNNPAALIPPMNNSGLNEYAITIAGKLTRFSNPPHHAVTKKIAMAVFQSMKPVSISEILKVLLHDNTNDGKINWVDAVCKQLPVLSILKGFAFSQTDCEFIIGSIGQLIKIMQPSKTEEQVKGINDVSEKVYGIVEEHICNSNSLSTIMNSIVTDTNYTKQEILSLCVSNLTGLMMQSYDASRGLLSNSLLQYLNNKKLYQHISNDKEQLNKFIIETIRYDPPVHNTRRVAAENILLNNIEIKEGEIILVVLAAANRDEQHFANANIFDIERNNNAEYLTFGAGAHACVASHFATQMVTETLFCLLTSYSNINLLSADIEYEPIINGRLPKSIIISLTQ